MIVLMFVARFVVLLGAPCDVYVADTGNAAVKVIPGGTGTPFSIGYGFGAPLGVFVNSINGDVYVAGRGG